MSIQTKIDTIIKSVGSINIQDFVEISNFDKDSGFYNKPNIEKIGKDGQFMTSPEISSLFRKLEILPNKIPTGAVILKRSDSLKIEIFFFIENKIVVKIIPIKAPGNDIPPCQTLNISKGF